MSKSKPARKIEQESPPLDLSSELLKLDDVARRLKITHPTVYRLLNSGQLKSVTILNRRFVTVRQLAEYIRALETGPIDLPKDSPNNRFRPKNKKSQHRASAR